MITFKKRYSLLFLVLLLFFSSLACDRFKPKTMSPTQVENQKKRLGYDLENPDIVYKLHYDLEEISGLSYFDENTIACIQDELGRFYINRLDERRIDHSLKFEKSGDYEGVEIVGDKAYVVKHNGTIYEFEYDLENDRASRIEKYATKLTAKNDVEGLGYLEDKNMLMLACKAKGEIDDDEKVKGKAVYGFSLDDKKLVKEPLFTVRKKQIQQFFDDHPEYYINEKAPKFNPSAIAQHPITKDIFILSASQPVLVILTKEGEFKDMAILRRRLFRQPEGITFAPNGDMFISNEGDGSRGNVNLFKYSRPE